MVRKIFGLDLVPFFPVVEFLERGLDQIAEGMVFDV